MFPTVRVTLGGPMLAADVDHDAPLAVGVGGVGGGKARFYVLLDVVPVDGKRYRYAYHRSSWLVAGKADPPAPARLYTHPDSPFSADQLRKQVISFEKVKLTNNEMDKQGQVSHGSRVAASMSGVQRAHLHTEAALTALDPARAPPPTGSDRIGSDRIGSDRATVASPARPTH